MVKTLRPLRLPALVLASALLAGCNIPGIESPEMLAAQREAEGKAIGSACRHAGRAIEDCFALNKKAEKSAMFAGWKEMNDYMRENKIAEIVPQIPAEAKASAPAPKADEEPEERPRKKTAKH